MLIGNDVSQYRVVNGVPTPLGNVLQAAGAPNGWTISTASVLSADGNAIAGQGYSPDWLEAYVATVPEPAGAAIAAWCALCIIIVRATRRVLTCRIGWAKDDATGRA